MAICLNTCMKSSEIVSEVILGGVRSPWAVVLSAAKEYLNKILHNTIFSSKPMRENFERITLAMDSEIINTSGCSEKG